MIKSLLDKLGFKKGMHAKVFSVPAHLEKEFASVSKTKGDVITWAIGFAKNSQEMEKLARDIIPLYQRGTHLWLCYPKQSGKIETDMTRDNGWEAVHQARLLPVSQVAIDEDWSALRFRYKDEIKRLTRATPTGGKAKT